MRFPRWQFLRVAVGVAVVAVFSFLLFMVSVSWSQSARTVKIIVPLAPGGPADIVIRLLAEEIGRTQGLSFVIENRPGAGTVIGTDVASRAAPDGNTLLMVSTPFVISPHVRKLSYDPLTSFDPICYLVRIPEVVVVGNASLYRTLADLIDAARANPGAVTMAGTGPATVAQIGFENLKRAANVNMVFVPYPGIPLAVGALLGDHVTAAIADYAIVAEQLKIGKLRALATTSPTRIEALPEVPTVAESGYKDYQSELWFGLVAPAKTPQEMLSKFAEQFTAAMQTPDIRAKLVRQGFYPVGLCGANFAALLRKEYDSYGRIIREMDVKME
jgi:tripartite-type tricarboxylate transporter receptor subunit TctC